MQTPMFRLEQAVRGPQETLEDFEGPLDLILHLLSKNKMEIRDIRISELVDQYLAYLELMKRMDLEIASEFVVMASHLVYIKSRMLLSLSDEQPEEELDLLMQALEQRRQQEDYRRIVVGRDFLLARADIGRSLYIKPPEPLPVDKTYTRTHSAEELGRALLQMQQRAERRRPPDPAVFSRLVGREPHPVSDMIVLVLRRLEAAGRLLFSVLLRQGRDRSGRVALFLAMLELCRDGRIAVDEHGEDYSLCLRGK
ncbi:MAG: segregation/condensation protein A [Oscillospiraceae bacterium]|jgi:segregation and condensation protein A|nr:segregation/condensation protein A [Oscillospiraceae bacterium]